MRYTILNIGDELPISDTAAARALEIAGDKLALRLGLQCEFTHNEILLACDYPIVPSPPLSTWDRELNGTLQDDKVATFLNATGEIGLTLSTSHTVSGGEFSHWNRLKKSGVDTIIHSFEYTSPEHNVIRYCGAISFILWSPFQRTGKSSYFIVRKEAYAYNLLPG
jgi:hypothetical protein